MCLKVGGVDHDLVGSALTAADVTVLYCHRYLELPGELPYKVIWEQVEQLRSFGTRVGRWLRQDKYDVVVVARFESTALLWLSNRLYQGCVRFVMRFHDSEGQRQRLAARAHRLFPVQNDHPAMDKVMAVPPSLAHYIDERVCAPGLAEYPPNSVR